MFAIISIVLFVMMFFFANPLSLLMQVPKEAVSFTAVYVVICGGGIFLLSLIMF